MKIFFSETENLDEANALYPPVSGSPGSAFGMSALGYACSHYARWYLPPKNRLLFGRSLTEIKKELCYSVSHSAAHVLVGVSEHPLGVDTEPRERFVSQRLVDGAATPEELEQFTFMELWCLKESYYKYKRGGDLRSMRFERRNGLIIGPENGVCFRLYDDIDGAVAAVCSPRYDFPEKLIHIPPEKLLKRD